MVKRIFPHAFVFLAFCLTMSLAIWQVQRLQWKENLLEKLNTRMTKPALAPADFNNVESQEYRTIQAFGEYDHKSQMQILHQTHNGKVGTHIITPFKSDDGVTFLVNRGWVPYEQKFEKPEGRTKVIGIAMKNPDRGHFSLDNESGKNIWYNIELPQMYAKIGLKSLPFYVDEIDGSTKNDTTYPIALPKEIKIYNEHLQYVITWFAMSIALLIMYYFRFFKKPKTSKAK